ncbi:hypothetical protein KAI52_02080 [Candidatus Parcubacteria bacterium]|nr:hypothetical protein [Candidatus Parcubacteria bacterium]
MERILIIEEDPNIFEKVYEWFLIPLLETSVKRGVEVYTGQEIVVINAQIPPEQLDAIKKMVKKSKVVLVFSPTYKVEQIKNFIDSDVGENFFYVKDEKKAIQTVLDLIFKE